MSERAKLALLTGTTYPELARSISRNLATPHIALNGLGREFGGNNAISHEFAMRMPVMDWHKPVYIINSTFNPRSTEELSQMTDAVAGAELLSPQEGLSVGSRPILIVPHWAYARQDKRGLGYSQTAVNHVRRLEEDGAAMIVTVDLHNKSIIEKSKRMSWYDVEPIELLAQAVKQMDPKTPIFIGPDKSAHIRAQHVANELGFPHKTGYFDKNRDPRLGGTELGIFWGDMLGGRFAIIVDDILSTSGSAIKAGERLLRLGARGYGIVTTHAPIVKDDYADAQEKIESSNASWVCFSDSLPQPGWVKSDKKLHVIPSCRFWAKVIEEIDSGDLHRGNLYHGGKLYSQAT